MTIDQKRTLRKTIQYLTNVAAYPQVPARVAAAALEVARELGVVLGAER